ncbi:uncharacterized protein STEHIDRAFT_160282 [Stereum hirsutum FP-91666 SS1]|uniref:uncharacterized protein n=1 Tax=Stereum hirsutum (strain FP-91666) TaxID=721885 RepID=UPI0004449B99|nr:uncharacterized protein STEHIDRAFT_160282 [Stereum hirsutum FP-91666 SS1]EIM82646.1 hypothetical protein STEHIDRAFT_160282 [Stereum hirsutum FP-91666 SS1]
MTSPVELTPEVLQDLADIVASKYFFVAGLSILILDHLVTFPDEVNTIWKKKKSIPIYLFIFLRYYALLVMVAVAYGFFSPTITPERCNKWSFILPFGVVMPLSGVSDLILLIRTYALFNRNRFILCFLSASLATQISLGLWIWTLKGSGAAPDPINNPTFHFCMFLTPKSAGSLAPLYMLFELAYESLIFILTMGRTVYLYKFYPVMSSSRRSLMECFIKGGAIYYSAIFCLNLVWAVLILRGPTGLRGMTSMPASAIGVTLICRITLNIRTEFMGPTNVFERTQNGIPLSEFNQRQIKIQTTTVTENFGSDTVTNYFEDD